VQKSTFVKDARRTSLAVGVLGAAIALGLGYAAARLPDARGPLYQPAYPAATQLVYKAGFESAPTAGDQAREIECLALNLYFEARGEPDLGKVGVGQVVMNRVFDRRFPKTVCDVVQQGGEQPRYACQFTWWCDGLSDKPNNSGAWDKSRALAEEIYWGRLEDPTKGALWYHADYVLPSWRLGMVRGPAYGRHVFYYRPAASLRLAFERLSD